MGSGDGVDMTYIARSPKEDIIEENECAEEANSRAEGEQNIQVAVRIRPVIPEETRKGIGTVGWEWNDGIVKSLPVGWQELTKEEMLGVGPGKPHKFAFENVLGPEKTNENVYKEVASTQVQSFVEGYNATILAYGQTTSGKTHTILGNPENNLPGLIEYALKDIFGYLADFGSKYSFKIEFSMFELYGEELRDLLTCKRKPLNVYDDKLWGPSIRGKLFQQTLASHVEGIHMKEITCADEGMELLRTGIARRTIADNNMSTSSSRAHTVLQFRLESRINPTLSEEKENDSSFHEISRDEPENYFLNSAKNRILEETKNSPLVAVSSLTIVDLAGSERPAKTKAKGKRLSEASDINKSLAALGKVITAINSKASHIPYRDSKLTRILSGALGGNSRTSILFCISPAIVHREESKSTMQFATRAAMVKTKAKLNKMDIGNRLIAQFKEEIALLRDELRAKENIHQGMRNRINYLEMRLSKDVSKTFQTPVLKRIKQNSSKTEQIKTFTKKVEILPQKLPRDNVPFIPKSLRESEKLMHIKENLGYIQEQLVITRSLYQEEISEKAAFRLSLFTRENQNEMLQEDLRASLIECEARNSISKSHLRMIELLRKKALILEEKRMKYLKELELLRGVREQSNISTERNKKLEKSLAQAIRELEEYKQNTSVTVEQLRLKSEYEKLKIYYEKAKEENLRLKVGNKLTKSINMIKHENEHLKIELNDLRDICNLKQNKNTTNEIKQSALQERLNLLQNESERLLHNLQAKDRNLNEIQNTLKELKAEVEEKRKTVDSQNKEKVSLKAELGILRSRINELVEKEQSFKIESEEKQTAIEWLNLKLKSLSKRNSEMKKAINEETDKFLEELFLAHKTIQKLELEMRELKRDLHAPKGGVILSKTKKKVDKIELQGGFNNTQRAISMKDSNLIENSERLTSIFSSKVDCSRKELISLQDSISHLHSAFEVSKKEIMMQMHHTLRDFKQDFESLINFASSKKKVLSISDLRNISEYDTKIEQNVLHSKLHKISWVIKEIDSVLQSDEMRDAFDRYSIEVPDFKIQPFQGETSLVEYLQCLRCLISSIPNLMRVLQRQQDFSSFIDNQTIKPGALYRLTSETMLNKNSYSSEDLRNAEMEFFTDFLSKEHSTDNLKLLLADRGSKGFYNSSFKECEEDVECAEKTFKHTKSLTEIPTLSGNNDAAYLLPRSSPEEKSYTNDVTNQSKLHESSNPRSIVDLIEIMNDAQKDVTLMLKHLHKRREARHSQIEKISQAKKKMEKLLAVHSIN